jgi:hypothetical protein
MEQRLRAQEAAARPATQILSPAPAAPETFASAFQAATQATQRVGKAAPTVQGPTGDPIVPPALRSGYEMASSAHAQVTVAKAAKPINVRIVSKSS